ncbi:hypothetical protein ACFL2S_13385 [Thermodesulfobacteriota bacterium]
MPKQIRTPDATFLHLSQGDNFEQFMRGFLQYLQSKLKVIEVKGKIDYQYYDCGFYHGRPDQYWQRFKNLEFYCDKKLLDFFEVKNFIEDHIGINKLNCECELLNNETEIRRKSLVNQYGTDFGVPGRRNLDVVL